MQKWLVHDNKGERSRERNKENFKKREFCSHMKNNVTTLHLNWRVRFHFKGIHPGWSSNPVTLNKTTKACSFNTWPQTIRIWSARENASSRPDYWSGVTLAVRRLYITCYIVQFLFQRNDGYARSNRLTSFYTHTYPRCHEPWAVTRKQTTRQYSSFWSNKLHTHPVVRSRSHFAKIHRACRLRTTNNLDVNF